MASGVSKAGGYVQTIGKPLPPVPAVPPPPAPSLLSAAERAKAAKIAQEKLAEEAAKAVDNRQRKPPGK
ncbi:MAG: hypothetical protein ABL930_11445 [Pseudobdellovibrio sp.]